jgi:hypothetical protein
LRQGLQYVNQEPKPGRSGGKFRAFIVGASPQEFWPGPINKGSKINRPKEGESMDFIITLAQGAGIIFGYALAMRGFYIIYTYL